MRLYVIEYRYRPDLKFLVEDMRPAHRTYLRDLQAQGRLITSGFLKDATFDGAMLVVHADTAEDAIALLDEDPFVEAGVVQDVIARQWIPTLGPDAADFDTRFPFS